MEREASYDKENSRSSSDLCLQHQKWVKLVCDGGICLENDLCEETHLGGRQLHCNASTGILSLAIQVTQFYSAEMKSSHLKPQLFHSNYLNLAIPYACRAEQLTSVLQYRSLCFNKIKIWLGLVEVGGSVWVFIGFVPFGICWVWEGEGVCSFFFFFPFNNCSPFCSVLMFRVRLLSSTTTLPNPTVLVYSATVPLKMQNNHNDIKWEPTN